MPNEDFSDIKPREATTVPHKTIKEQLPTELERVPQMEKQKPELGIQNLKEVVIVVCRGINGVVKSLADQKIGLGDLVNFRDVVIEFNGLSVSSPLVEAVKNIDLVPAEVSNLQPEELEEIKALVEAELDLKENTEAVVVKAMEIAVKIAELIKLLNPVADPPSEEGTGIIDNVE